MNPFPEEDILAEARGLIEALNDIDIMARLIGGLGIASHNHTVVPTPLRRNYADIDLVIGKKHGSRLTKFLLGRGYLANEKFNALHGAKRMLFYDKFNNRQIDVFVGSFDMCHFIELDKFLTFHKCSLAPEYLLLTKLQIIQLNQKDLIDVVRLLLMHQNKNSFASDCPGFSMKNLDDVLCMDWGWYTTVTDNLLKVQSGASKILDDENLKYVNTYISEILAHLNDAPKSIKWKARAVIGRNKIWYEIPEEISGK